MHNDLKVKYADNRRRGLFAGKTKRVIWKSRSRNIA